MPQFTNRPIVLADAVIGNSTSAMIAWLDTNLRAAGWTATAITGGFDYLLQSPQNINAHVQIWDPGLTNPTNGVHYINVRFLPDGIVHELGVWTALAGHTTQENNRHYQIWANCCQFFVSVRDKYGATADPWAHSVNGGVPFVLGLDAYPALPATVWWSESPGPSAVIVPEAQHNFRKDLENWPVGGVYYAASFDGQTSKFDVAAVPPVEDQLMAITRQPARFNPYSPLGMARQWFLSGRPFFLEPFLTWGYQPMQPVLGAQIWDGVLATAADADTDDAPATVDFYAQYKTNPLVADAVLASLQNYVWQRFTHFVATSNPALFPGDYSGGLYLLVSKPSGGGGGGGGGTGTGNYVY